MQLRLLFDVSPFETAPAVPPVNDVAPRTATAVLLPETPPAPIHFFRSPRAKRYILRVLGDGTVRVTIPRRGSKREAERFADRYRAWIETQRLRRASAPAGTTAWTDGTRVLLRGEPIALQVAVHGEGQRVAFAHHALTLPHRDADVRADVIRALRRQAIAELPPRLRALAATHGLTVTRVSVRNQRARWGSCSSTGRISLNWRLIQTPDRVRDYVMLHELMHLRQPNHSRRFWRLVADVCPDYQDARRWLHDHEGRLLTDASV